MCSSHEWTTSGLALFDNPPAPCEDEAMTRRDTARTASRTVREVLSATALDGARVLAGASGLERPVERLNIMEVPDIRPWVKPREFLLTTAYPLRDQPDRLPELVADLDDLGLSGLGVKLGRYLDSLPPRMLEVADARGFPIVLLPDGVGFDEILDEVLTAILNDQAEQLARAERVHRAFLDLVLRGHGLPEIVRDLSGLLDRPTAIVGHDGRVLAACRLDELGLADPARLELDPSAGSVLVAGDRFDATAVRITDGLREHGWVVALAREGPPPSDLLTLESAATVAALALAKALELRAVEDKYRSDLVHDLLRGVDDPEDARRRARGFGWDLERRLIALVLRLDTPPATRVGEPGSPGPHLGATVEPVVGAHDPAAALVRFTNEVVVLMGAFEGPGGREDARAFTRRLVIETARVAGTSVSAGMSRPVESIEDVPRAYDQAARALSIGRDIHGPGAVAHFDDLGAYRVLSLVEDRAELDAFAAEVLGELYTDDDTAADLRHTLEVVLDTGGNVAEAARRLHFHYNTLRYRIDKLSSIVGPFTTDARVRLDVQLALLVRAMRQLDR
jgi:PucR family transcriptional regulator, purine catabolism regulatory protein